MTALVCDQPLATEAFYTKHFGFRRARVYLPGPQQVVVLKASGTYLQLFPAFAMRPPCLDAPQLTSSPYPGGGGAGPLYGGVRKLAFLVSDVARKLADMGNDAVITQRLQPGLIEGSRIVWIADPSGNVIELIEGYSDEANPPAMAPVPEFHTALWQRPQDIATAIAAARVGDLSALRHWLSAGGNPNQYDAGGWTPLLAAAVRGQSAAVDLLLNNGFRKADPQLCHLVSGALPIHLAGQSGDVETARFLIETRPDHLDRVWELNGHTLLLQAVFFGHMELTNFALKRGASTSATTVRGLAPLELAQQFENRALMDLMRPYDSPQEAKTAYYRRLLGLIAPMIPAAEAAMQELSDRLVKGIEWGFQQTAQNPAPASIAMAQIRGIVETEKADVNRLGGPLQQPPLVTTVTGNNGSPANESVAVLRKQIAGFLLEKGADPLKRERHPMAVNAVIRAAVFNHLEILQMMAGCLSPDDLTFALNEQPAVNGLTALHDTVLRASTAEADRLQGYLAQIRWCVGKGARSDIEDFSGRTQRQLAEAAVDPQVRQRILDNLDLRAVTTRTETDVLTQ
jgi:glyoxylase I family protein